MPLGIKNLIYIAIYSGFEFIQTWIPDHTDVRGNKKADVLANIGKLIKNQEKTMMNKYDNISTMI